jgi:hypothetical protein
MDVAYISAASALGGSLLGSLSSGIATWLSQREAARAELRRLDKSRRVDLYRDFIMAVSKLYADAKLNDNPPVQEIVALYAMVSRMRIVSSPEIVACAEKIMQTTTDTYFAPNMTFRELHDLIRSGSLDPLKDFSELTREELQSMSR